MSEHETAPGANPFSHTSFDADALAGPTTYDPTARPGAPYPPGYHPQPARSARWGKVGGGAAAGVGAAAKMGVLAKFFLALKGAALLVKFKFAATMLLSVGAYTLIYGWRFAVGIVALLAIHEFGHVAAFRAQGVRVSLPTFVPFLGAYVKAESPVRSPAHQAAAALAGPVAGALGAAGCILLWHATGSPVLHALAYFGFFLTFLNLLPLAILDGARVVSVLHPAVFLAALGAGVAFEVANPSRMFPLLIIFGVIALYDRWRNRARYAATYRATPRGVRASLGAAYLVVALASLWGMNVLYLVPRR
jgi:Zn-dependent protease